VNVLSDNSSASVVKYDVSSQQHFIKLQKLVQASGSPNCVSCRLAVPSRLNISVWRSFLRDYSDAKICEFMEFGWPVGYDYATYGFPVSDFRNHTGRCRFRE
jgi:hypothetical protein